MKERDERPVMVTIRCLVYNHEAYVRQCLEGFVMQQTNFRFEAIVHDDASTDGSAAIIREYAEKYPDIIKPIFQKENQYSKKDGSIARILNAQTRGKYIAMCEGDDYWTDPLKLQKQVDFLESHPDYVMCSHFWNELDQDTQVFSSCQKVVSKTYDLSCLINEEWLFQPLSILFRVDAYRKAKKYSVSRDTVLIYSLLKEGKGYCMPDYMGVYRRHGNGVWAGVNDDLRWLSDYNVRRAIYEVELSDDAALFLLNALIRKPIGRSFLLKQIKKLYFIFKVTARHRGIKDTLVIFYRRFFYSSLYRTNF